MKKQSPNDPSRPPGRGEPSSSEPDATPNDLPVDVGPGTDAPDDAVVSGPATPPGEAIDYRDRWLRTEAELQNYRRRAQRDAEESRRLAEDRLLREVIDVLDDLDRALGAAPHAATKAGQDDAWSSGINLVAAKMRELLSRAGVTAIDALGRPFDPHEHEALLEVDAPEGRAPGEVVTVVRAGYRRGDRVLRPARVAVARARVEA